MMLFDEQYIKMCEKAEEIQKGHEWVLGQWYYDKTSKDEYAIRLITWFIIEAHDYWNKTKAGYFHKMWEPARQLIQAESEFWDMDYYVWLPTQEDLQGMMEDVREERGVDKKGSEFWIWREFNQFALFKACGNDLVFPTLYSVQLFLRYKTMRALWLAFVMHEKYGEEWDAEKEEWRPSNP